MDIQKIEELIQVIDASRTEGISVSKGDCTISIRKGCRPKPVSKSKRLSSPIQPSPAKEEIAGEQFVRAPMVGIFHVIDEDGIKPGTAVKAGQVIGTIESMKLLNDVVSGVTGKVLELLVEDGTPVEYGQPLYRVESL